jgi:hypothetical protein
VRRKSLTLFDLRNRGVDLSPILLYQPKLLRRPEISARGLLRITGFFPTSPERIKFDLFFEPVQGRWRLYGLSVDTFSPPPAATGAVAPHGPAQGPQTAATPTPPKPAAAPRKPDSQSSGSAASKNEKSSDDFDIRDRIEEPAAAPARG